MALTLPKILAYINAKIHNAERLDDTLAGHFALSRGGPRGKQRHAVASSSLSCALGLTSGEHDENGEYLLHVRIRTDLERQECVRSSLL